MIHPQRPLQHFTPAQVIDREYGTALIGVHEKGESLGFLGRLIAREGDVYYFAVSAASENGVSEGGEREGGRGVLGEDGNNVSFR